MDSKWAYMAMLDRLSMGDITKDETIFDLEWESCLHRLLYWNHKDEYYERKRKVEESQSKSRNKR